MSGGIFLFYKKFYNGILSVSEGQYIRIKINIRKTKENTKIKLSLQSSIQWYYRIKEDVEKKDKDEIKERNTGQNSV